MIGSCFQGPILGKLVYASPILLAPPQTASSIRYFNLSRFGKVTPMNIGGLALFAFVSSITPGPNNIMLWGSGMNYGFRRTIPHLAGVNLGFASLIFAVNLGLGSLFDKYPSINNTLRVIGSVYLFYLAYKIAASAGVSEESTGKHDSEGMPISFPQAAAFQVLNPKAWIMAATSASTFLPSDKGLVAGATSLTAVFAAINLPCITTWAAAGTGIGRILTNQRRRRLVNGFLGLLLVGGVMLINR